MTRRERIVELAIAQADDTNDKELKKVKELIEQINTYQSLVDYANKVLKDYLNDKTVTIGGEQYESESNNETE